MNEDEDVEMGGNRNSSNEGEENTATYLPGQPLKEDEELVCDESVYAMLHEVHTGKHYTPRGYGCYFNVAVYQKYGNDIA
jgi:hypothetical protein